MTGKTRFFIDTIDSPLSPQGAYRFQALQRVTYWIGGLVNLLVQKEGGLKRELTAIMMEKLDNRFIILEFFNESALLTDI